MYNIHIPCDLKKKIEKFIQNNSIVKTSNEIKLEYLFLARVRYARKKINKKYTSKSNVGIKL